MENEIKLFQQSNNDKETKFSLKTYLLKLAHNLATYRTHKIRSVHDKKLLASVIDKLRDDEVLIIADWKMKLLLLEYRESMHAFFGKRGIPWHGTLFIRNKLHGEYKLNGKENVLAHLQSDKVIQYVDTLVDNAAEDGHAVSSILEYNIKDYKNRNPHIDNAILMTDGAGCYSGTFLLCFLSVVYKMTGVKILRHFVSEAGQGKTMLDTHFSYAGRHVITSVQSGKGARDIMSASDCVTALRERGGIANSTSHCLKFGTNNTAWKKMGKIKDLYKYSHREYIYGQDGSFESVQLYCTYFRGNPITIVAKLLLKKWPTSTTPASLFASEVQNILNNAVIKEQRSDRCSAISSEDKSKVKRVRDMRINDRMLQQTIERSSIDALNVKRIKEGNLHQCPSCKTLYSSNFYFKRHELTCQKDLPKQPFRSSVIGKAQSNQWLPQLSDCFENQIVLPNQDLNTSHTRKLLDGNLIQLPDNNFLDCVKSRGKSSKRTSAQLSFIIDCMEIGNANKQQKLSPSFACKLMKFVGTVEGHALAQYDFAAVSDSGCKTFCRKDCLDIQQIKGYFSKKVPAIKVELTKCLLREQSSNTITATDEIEEILRDDDI